MTRDAILVLNAGSSSVKFALTAWEDLAPLCHGQIGHLGSGPRCEAFGALASHFDPLPLSRDARHEAAVAALLARLQDIPGLRLRGAGHRVVHGGAQHGAPARIDARTLDALEALSPLAPAHQPHNLAGVRAVAAAAPHVPQVACFDTAFHRTQPRVAQTFPIPRALTEAGMIRYGFHGLSYEHIADVLPAIAGPRAEGRIIVAHLGNGASLCAMRERRSVASTMGFTALDGLMMGARSGAIDPGLVLHLIRGLGMSADDVSNLLNTESGLLGVSGISNDLRELEASADPRAEEAMALFAYRVVRESGSLIAALGGLDAFVFTAGIGEHSAAMRARICAGLAFAGVTLDPARNGRGEMLISAESSAVPAYVVPADEETPIARATRRLVAE